MSGKTINSLAFSSGSINSTGVAYSQGTQYWEYFNTPNSDSLNTQAFGGLLNGDGIAFDQRPKTDAAPIFKLYQQIVNSENSDSIVQFEGYIKRTEPSALLQSTDQIVGLKGSGNVSQYWQTIQLRAAVDVPESIASFEQTTTRNEGSGSLFYLSQRVRDLNTQTPKPFEIDLTVGGYQIKDSELTGTIEVSRGESEAALLVFSIFVPEGDVNDYVEQQGKSVILNYTDNATGKTERLFTGTVDIPEIDFLQGIATYRCTDARREAINALDQATVDQWGYWSEDVFGDYPDETFDYVEQRLQTMQYSLDMNRFGGLKLTSWTPKTTADITLSDSDVFRRKPGVEVLSRGRVVNRVSVEMEFQYDRLRYREQKYQFYGTGLSSICDYFSIGSPVKKEMIHEALKSTSWAYKDMVMKDAACGSTRCGGSSFYSRPCGYYDGYYQDKKDADGNVVKDSSGNVVQEFKTTSYVATYKQYAGSASWTMFKRFAQNISEKVNVVVEAPQSIAQYGVVEKRQTMGVAIDYDTTDFENMDFVYDKSNFSTSSNGDLYLDLAYLVAENGKSRWYNAYNTAIARAKTSILASHRDNTVTIETDILPTAELSDTAEMTSATWTACKGKVGSIKHSIDLIDRIATTELEIKLSRAIGTPPTEVTPNADAARPQNRDDAPKTPQTITLRTKVIDKDAEVTEDMIGAIYKSDAYNVLAAFAVNTPEIVEARDNKELLSNNTIQIGIPNNSLTIRHKR